MQTVWIIRNAYEGKERSTSVTTERSIQHLCAAFAGRAEVKVVDLRGDTKVKYLERFLDSATAIQSLRHHPIKTGDVIYFLAAEFIGSLLALRAFWALQGIYPKLAGLWRTSVGIEGDAVGLISHYVEEEKRIAHALDLNFMCSQYVADRWSVKDRPFAVVGLPLHSIAEEELAQPIRPTKERERLIVYPHRLDYSKNPLFFADFAHIAILQGWRVELLSAKQPPSSFYLSALRAAGVQVRECHEKADYYQALREAAVCFSCSTLESYGYAMIEAAQLGAIPWCPRFGPYPEIFDSSTLYGYSLIAAKEAGAVYHEMSDLLQRHENTLAGYSGRLYLRCDALGSRHDEQVAHHLEYLLFGGIQATING